MLFDLDHGKAPPREVWMLDAVYCLLKSAGEGPTRRVRGGKEAQEDLDEAISLAARAGTAIDWVSAEERCLRAAGPALGLGTGTANGALLASSAPQTVDF